MATSKDKIELSLKILGAFAIFTPIFLFFNQNRIDRDTKRSEKLSELLVSISYDIEVFVEDNDTSTQYKAAIQNLYLKYPSQLAVLKNDSINYYYNNKIIGVILSWEYLKNFNNKVFNYTFLTHGMKDEALHPQDDTLNHLQVLINDGTYDLRRIYYSAGTLGFMQQFVQDTVRLQKNIVAIRGVAKRYEQQLNAIPADLKTEGDVALVYDVIKGDLCKKFEFYESYLSDLEDQLDDELVKQSSNLQRVILAEIKN